MVDRVYVFDLDDTLYLERHFVWSGFTRVGEIAQSSYGTIGVGDYARSLFEQGIRGNTFDLVVAHYSLPPSAVGVFIGAYRDHEPSITLEEDAMEYLTHLPDDAVGTGVITDGYPPGQWRKVRALGIDELVENVVVTGDYGTEWTKPSEHAFRLLESRYPGSGVEFIYFGDNPKKDFQAPRRMGWRTVRVRRPLGLHYETDDEVLIDATIEAFPLILPATKASVEDPREYRSAATQ
jgi:putative hydrolase of the HAD superfamily